MALVGTFSISSFHTLHSVSSRVFSGDEEVVGSKLGLIDQCAEVPLNKLLTSNFAQKPPHLQSVCV